MGDSLSYLDNLLTTNDPRLYRKWSPERKKYLRRLKWQREKTRKLAFTLSHGTFEATMSSRRIVPCKSESSTRTLCKYIQGHCGNFKHLFILSNICKIELWRKMHFQITGDKVKNVSLCPCLLATQVVSTDSEKIKVYRQSSKTHVYLCAVFS